MRPTNHTSAGPWPDLAGARSFLAALAGGDGPPALPPAATPPLAGWLQAENLAPWVYWHLRQVPGADPHGLLPLLAPAYWASAAANAIKWQLLAQVTGGLTNAGIPFLLLKGIAHSLVLYPDPALRPMNDLDFWIRREDLPAVWRLMTSQGYTTQALYAGPEAVPPHIVQASFYPQRPEDSPFNLEFHWDLVARPAYTGRLPLDAWWQRAISTTWQGRSLRLLDPSAALLNATVHLMLQHRGEGHLGWLLDIDRLVRGAGAYCLDEEDWALVEAEAAAAGILPPLQEALRLAQGWFATPLPAPAQALLAAPAPPADRARYQDLIRHRGTAAGILAGDLAALPGWRGKLSLARTVFFPAPAYMMQRYAIPHRALLPLYYAGRLLKAVWMALLRRRR